jgi:hypothetical protein
VAYENGKLLFELGKNIQDELNKIGLICWNLKLIRFIDLEGQIEKIEQKLNRFSHTENTIQHNNTGALEQLNKAILKNREERKILLIRKLDLLVTQNNNNPS